jgi:hypothetical protein
LDSIQEGVTNLVSFKAKFPEGTHLKHRVSVVYKVNMPRHFSDVGKDPLIQLPSLVMHSSAIQEASKAGILLVRVIVPLTTAGVFIVAWPDGLFGVNEEPMQGVLYYVGYKSALVMPITVATADVPWLSGTGMGRLEFVHAFCGSDVQNSSDATGFDAEDNICSLDQLKLFENGLDYLVPYVPEVAPEATNVAVAANAGNSKKRKLTKAKKKPAPVVVSYETPYAQSYFPVAALSDLHQNVALHFFGGRTKEPEAPAKKTRGGGGGKASANKKDGDEGGGNGKKDSAGGGDDGTASAGEAA